MDQCSINSSFYEAPVVYDAGKTSALYENLQKNFEDIHASLKSLDKDMGNLQKQSSLTVKLIEKIKSGTGSNEAAEKI